MRKLWIVLVVFVIIIISIITACSNPESDSDIVFPSTPDLEEMTVDVVEDNNMIEDIPENNTDYSVDLLISMSSSEQKALNDFLGSFAQQLFNEYDINDNCSDADLINFAFYYLQQNYSDKINLNMSEGVFEVDGFEIANVVFSLFDRSIIHQTISDPGFWYDSQKEIYRVFMSNAASNTYFVTAKTCKNIGDGLFAIEYDVTEDNLGALSDFTSGTAIIQPYSEPRNYSNYKLIAYKQQIDFTEYSRIIQEEILASYESNKNTIDEVALIESTFTKTKKKLINDLYGYSAEALYTNTKLIGSKVTYDGNTVIVEIAVDHCSNVFDFYGMSTYSFYAKAKFDLDSMEMYYFTYE